MAFEFQASSLNEKGRYLTRVPLCYKYDAVRPMYNK